VDATNYIKVVRLASQDWRGRSTNGTVDKLKGGRGAARPVIAWLEAFDDQDEEAAGYALNRAQHEVDSRGGQVALYRLPPRGPVRDRCSRVPTVLPCPNGLHLVEPGYSAVTRCVRCGLPAGANGVEVDLAN